jgi:hypothetical protein
MCWVIYCMMGLGYALAVNIREPSRFSWVAIGSGVLFPFLLGFALADWFYIVSKKTEGKL